MIYGFATRNPFTQNETEKREKSVTTYSLPRVVPAVYIGNR
jgi:hypothetical protein